MVQHQPDGDAAPRGSDREVDAVDLVELWHPPSEQRANNRPADDVGREVLTPLVTHIASGCGEGQGARPYPCPRRGDLTGQLGTSRFQLDPRLTTTTRATTATTATTAAKIAHHHRMKTRASNLAWPEWIAIAADEIVELTLAVYMEEAKSLFSSLSAAFSLHNVTCVARPVGRGKVFRSYSRLPELKLMLAR